MLLGMLELALFICDASLIGWVIIIKIWNDEIMDNWFYFVDFGI